ncbi:MAG: HD domain-containing protein [Rickettsia endosymbiont of Glossina mortisans submortisans]|nr:HD domain-containing protein [Rickettsia endosymbiont of Glossina mortisans submortisans]
MQVINNYLESCCYSEKLLGKISLLNKRNIALDYSKIKQAIYYAKKYHGNQKRKTGEPYYSHPLEVAYIILDWSLDSDVIIAALLHDTVEDTEFTLEKITFLFNHNISQLVSKVTKLNDSINIYRLTEEEIILKLTSGKQSQKAILIKLVDRLHNLRTIKYMPPLKQIKKAKETLRIYVPLAKYLGIKAIEQELIELAVSILQHH